MKKDMNLVFFGKCHQMTSPSSLDVRITDGKTCTTVTFSNKALPITKTGDYVMFAVDGNKLYFEISDDRNGYKLQKKASRSTTASCVSGVYARETLKKFEGLYRIEYDKETKHHFIEKNQGTE